MQSQGLIKVTEDVQNSRYRRVAKFLTLIGVEQASTVIKLLPQELVERIIPEIATIRHISAEEAQSIMTEFQSLLQASRQSGGVQTAREILEKAYGSDKAQQVLEKAVPFKDGKPFSCLEHENPEKIHLVLKDESEYVKSVVISYLPSAQAAAVINLMTESEKKETMLRLARIQGIQPDVLVHMDAAIREKIKRVQFEKVDTMDGRNALAEILKHMSPGNETVMLEKLAETDPDLSEHLRERLFTIEDIEQSRGRFLQEYLRSMDDHSVALLIAGKPDSFREKIFQNISTGRGDMILEEDQLVQPVRKADSDMVTQSFLSAMRAAWSRGDLYIPGRDEDEYVQ